jgi:hypothetical protein
MDSSGGAFGIGTAFALFYKLGMTSILIKALKMGRIGSVIT